MTITVYQTQFPPKPIPLVDNEGRLTNDGMAFLRALYLRTGGGSGVQYTADNNLVATGATLADALPLQSDWSNITGGAGSGVALPALTMGQSVTVFNNSGGNISMYAPAGYTLTVIGVVGSPYVSTAPDALLFYYFSDTDIIAI